MNVQIMVTISGSNQIDLIKILSDKTHTLGGKWLNSKISHIDNYIAGLTPCATFKIRKVLKNA